MTGHENIPVRPETKRRIDELKREAEAESFNELVVMMVEDNLDASWEALEVQETEERIERTRATVVAILEAVEELDLTDEVLDIVKTLSQQNMLAKNQEIVDHLLEKSGKDAPLNEVDRLLAQIVMETEQEREKEQTPAAEIAQGLFSPTDRTTAERRKLNRQKESKSAEIGDDGESPVSDTNDGLFDGIEGAGFSVEPTEEIKSNRDQ